MKTKRAIKHLAGLSGAVASFLVVAALIALTPSVKANKPPPSPPVTYSYYIGSATLGPVGDEPNALGSATLTATQSYQILRTYVGGHVDLSCSGLTPNASYIVSMSGVLMAISSTSTNGGIADSTGNLDISSDFRTPNFKASSTPAGSSDTIVGMPGDISVYRVESSTTYVLVLSGPITWQQVHKLPKSSVLPSSLQAADAPATATADPRFNATYVVTPLVEHDGYYYVWSGTGSGTVLGPSSELAYVHIAGKKALSQGTFTAQNGDELYIEATQTWEASTQSWVGTFSVVGGTGRFAAATGGGTVTATPNPDGSMNNILNGMLNL